MLLSQWPAAQIGKWFVFHDANGRGHCQPDAFVHLTRSVLLFEMKLTQTHEAFLQMAQLYVPVLEHVYKKPCLPVQICRTLREPPEHGFDPIVLPPAPRNVTWHYLGR